MTQRTYLTCLFLIGIIPLLFGQQARQFPFQGNNLAYIPSINKLLLSGRGSDLPSGENALYTCDPVTGEIEQILNPTGIITSIQVTADNSEVYLSTNRVDSTFFVLNLPDLSFNRVFNLGPSPAGQNYFPSDWRLSPTDPDLFAIIRRNLSNNQRELALYDQDQARDNTLDFDYATFVFSPQNDRLYIKDNSNTGHLFQQINFDGNGLIEPDTSYRFFQADSNLPLFGDRIYSQDGTVIDVSGPYPKFVAYHAYRTQGHSGTFYESQTVYVDLAEKELYHLRWASTGTNHEAHIFDSDHLDLKRIVQYNAPVNPNGGFVHFGSGLNYGYFIGGSLVIVQECEQVPTTPDPEQLIGDQTVFCSEDGFARTDVPLSSAYGRVFSIDGEPLDTLREVYQNMEFQVRVADDNGCLSEPTKPFTVNVAHTFQPPQVLGLGEFGSYNDITPRRCENGNAFLWAYIQGVSDDQRIIWSTGDTTSGYLVTNVTEPITARILTKEGCISEPSESLTIEVVNSTVSEPPTMIGQDAILHECNGQSTKTLVAEEGFENYIWRAGDDIGGGIAFQLRQDDSHEGVYLHGMEVNGCWTDYRYENVKFFGSGARPQTPDIEQLDNFLTATEHGVEYEWYFNGTAIPNSDQAVWTAEEPGEYQVRVKNSYCWSRLSAIVIIP